MFLGCPCCCPCHCLRLQRRHCLRIDVVYIVAITQSRTKSTINATPRHRFLETISPHKLLDSHRNELGNLVLSGINTGKLSSLFCFFDSCLEKKQNKQRVRERETGEKGE
ncbi:uncharacterized protein DS421_3g97240 [Arachis hypogaea]|nr:uncharacterized protein DS421_3g97240 [Arachis hypogaea]